MERGSRLRHRVPLVVQGIPVLSAGELWGWEVPPGLSWREVGLPRCPTGSVGTALGIFGESCEEALAEARPSETLET